VTTKKSSRNWGKIPALRGVRVHSGLCLHCLWQSRRMLISSGLWWQPVLAQSWVMISYLLSNIRRLASAVKQQRPLVQWASLRLLRVEDNEQLPASSRVLGPRLCRHERPLSEPGSTFVVAVSLAQKHRPSHHTSYRDHGRPQASARGTLAPSRNVLKCFVH